MFVRDFLVQEFALETRHNYPDILPTRYRINQASFHNFLRILALVIPVANTIIGIIGLVRRDIYDRTLRINSGHWPEYQDEWLSRIITCSFCIASLGLLLVPVMIAATIMKYQDLRSQNRNVKQIGPDYLL